MIRVLIVDDHRVVRLGLEALIQETKDLEMVGWAANGLDAITMAEELRPDVILMDLSMPGMDGVDATKAILDQNSEINVVVLTSFSDRERVLAALDAGATGYQLKDAETVTLLDGIRNAAAGHAPLDPRVATEVLASRAATTSSVPHLTAREEQVLQLVGRGLINKQIARELNISESTVKTHLTNVFQTIGVQDRTQAALWVQRRDS